jgi:hypothetical protein
MLHATLHGKLALLTPEAERLEDAITSTVFGTLAMVERWDVLSQWLSPSPDSSPSEPNDIWFWPTLRTPGCTTIPDVCVRLGNRLIVVEAKYRSGRNDLASNDETPDQMRDQLVRQYRCLSAAAEERIGCV